MRIGSMVGVVASSLATACLEGTCLQNTAFAASGGCPTILHVPADAPSIDAAVEQACAGVPLEVVVAPGTWTMASRVPGNTLLDITVRGAGGGETIVTDVGDGIGLIDVTGGSTAFACTLKDLTVAGVVGSSCWLTFDGCLVRDCSATFLTYVGTTRDTRFERCTPNFYSTILYTGVAVEDCEFVDCTSPVLLWSDGPAVLRGSTFTNTVGHAVRCYASCCAFGNNIYTIEDCHFTGTVGNAVKLEFTPHPDAPPVRTNFIGCTFTDNTVPAGGLGGGAVRVGITGLKSPLPGDATLTTFTDCTFTGNAAPNGGAIFAARNHHIELTGCTFASNVATNGRGGAIGQEFGGYDQRLAAEGCNFIGNSAAKGAGGALSVVGWDGRLQLSACGFRENGARSGGAIASDRTNLDIQGCTFEENTASEPLYEAGGAIAAFISGGIAGGPPSLDDRIRTCTFRDNAGGGAGGAIAFYYRVATAIEDCVFENNAAGRVGGGISINEQCLTAIRRSTFEGNTASTGGSGVFTISNTPVAPVVVDECSFRAQAPSAAGAAAIDAFMATNLANSTFCASGTDPFLGSITETSSNCIAEYCTDFDANGTPDACECATNPALPSCCLGDLFNDGAVNAADLAVVLTQWGEKGPALEADLDGNGVVNGVDLAIVLSQWGPCR